jgi:hypothetical protein
LKDTSCIIISQYILKVGLNKKWRLNRKAFCKLFFAMDSTTVARKFEYPNQQTKFGMGGRQPALKQGFASNNSVVRQPQWPRGLRHGSAVARLLELWIQIPLAA